MGFSDFARDARRNTPKPNTPKVESNDMADAIMEDPKPAIKKQDISYKDSEISGFVPQPRSMGSRQSMDSRHGSIVRGIANASSMSSQMGGNATWENCKHRKTNSGRDFCAEYHSLCAKERCRKAVR